MIAADLIERQVIFDFSRNKHKLGYSINGSNNPGNIIFSGH